MTMTRALCIRVPAGINDLESFRRWCRSDAFPERGRIDWLGSGLEIDMSPEKLSTHGTPKSALALDLGLLIERTGRGHVLIDRSRYCCEAADLSAEPDLLVVLHQSIAGGSVRLIPAQTGTADAIEGRADLVVEVVSDSSEEKDREELLERYHLAGVPEYWIVDARGEEIGFEVHLHSREGYLLEQPDSLGYRHSPILGRGVTLVRERTPSNTLTYRLETRES